MKKRVGGESSDSKEGKKAAAKVHAFPRVEERGRCREKAEEIRGLACLFGEINSKNRCLWNVLRSGIGGGWV